MVQFEIINDELKIEKQLSKLDLFVIDTINIVSKYVDYVIISGYVSIFFGRARATEDVDIFIGSISEDKFKELYNEALQNGYEFNIDNPEDLYNEYLNDNLSINLWKKDLPLVRLEIKLAKKQSQILSIRNKIKVFFSSNHLYFSPIEYQIAYKRLILKSNKDIEDARHLEIVFRNLNQNKMTEYGKLILREFENE